MFFFFCHLHVGLGLVIFDQECRLAVGLIKTPSTACQPWISTPLFHHLSATLNIIKPNQTGWLLVQMLLPCWVSIDPEYCLTSCDWDALCVVSSFYCACVILQPCYAAVFHLYNQPTGVKSQYLCELCIKWVFSTLLFRNSLMHFFPHLVAMSTGFFPFTGCYHICSAIIHRRGCREKTSREIYADWMLKTLWWIIFPYT